MTLLLSNTTHLESWAFMAGGKYHRGYEIHLILKGYAESLFVLEAECSGYIAGLTSVTYPGETLSIETKYVDIVKWEPLGLLRSLYYWASRDQNYYEAKVRVRLAKPPLDVKPKP